MYHRKHDDTYVNAAYHEIGGGLLADLKQFEHGRSMSAQWEYATAKYRPHYLAEGHNDPKVYVVYSYATPIALYDPRDRTLYRIDYTYSVTTSRQQSLLWPLARTAQYVVDVRPGNGSAASAASALRTALRDLAPA